jgi:hypothetical protein
LFNLDTDHASATFRGFRLQTLYAVHRIFSSPIELFFIPEGAEDLAVFDAKGRLQEAIQVKSGNSNLTLSDLKDSFFERSIKRLTTHPNSRLRIVMFGLVGPELKNACNQDGKERHTVIQKIINRENFTVSKEDVQRLLEVMHIDEVDEERLRCNILELLKDSLAGVDSESAFELLSKWIDQASETRTQISRTMLDEKIISIGKFLNGRVAYHEEWFRTVIPIEDAIVVTDSTTLSNNYYQGEAARFEHILSNLDVKRDVKLNLMRQLLKERNVLFVHGASGQGKSTLAYRFLHDYYPQTLRFKIAITENRQHALNMALAIYQHIKAMELPAIIFIDVSPHDNGWEELVKTLSVYPNIQLLITIREEDWNKARISGVEFVFHEINLQFDASEAEQIFDVLVTQGKVQNYLIFSEAWEAFGGYGPLLEFVYLLTQGGRLQERLQKQINDLTSELHDSDKTLKLLYCVAIATACGARMNVKETVKYFEINPRKTFKRLQNEYLLRLDDSKSWISAFHPLRSVILEQLLFDPGYATWIDQIESILKLLHPEDIEMFLLHSFSKHFEERHELLKILYMYHPKNWIAVKGVIRALSWLDVKEFIQQRLDYIKDIYGIREGYLVLSFGADIMKIGNNEWKDILESPFFTDEQRKNATEIRERLGLEHFEFVFLPQWLKHLEPLSNMPESDREWMAFAITCLWVWKCNAHDKIAFDFKHLKYDASLSIQTVAEVTRILFYAYPELYPLWIESYRAKTLQRLQNEYLICEIEEQDESIKAHFISIDLRTKKVDNTDDAEKNIVHEKTIFIVDLLNMFYPEKNHFGTQGYGQQLLGIENFDDSTKNISKQNMYIQEFVTINALLRRSIENYFRPDSWESYLKEVLDTREQIADTLLALLPLLNRYFQNKKPIDTLRENKGIELLVALEPNVRRRYLLPKNVVDTFGYFDETDEVDSEGKVKSISISTKRYKPFQKAWSDYLGGLQNFLTQASFTFELNALFGKETNAKQKVLKQEMVGKGIHVDQNRLSWINLSEAKKALPPLQNEFDLLFKDFTNEKRIHVIENKECEAMQKLMPMWYFFAFHSNVQTKKADLEFKKRFDERKNELLSKFVTLLNSNNTECNFSILDSSMEEILWIAVEHNNPLHVWHGCFEAIEVLVPRIIEQSDFSKAVIQHYYKELRFLPVAQGHYVNSMYIPIDLFYATHAFPDEELSPLQFIPRQLLQEEIDELPFNIFTSDDTELLHTLFETISKLMVYLKHIKEFKACPDASTDTGSIMLMTYTEKINIHINDALNEALQKCSEFTDVLQTYDEKDSLELKERFHEVYNSVFYEKISEENVILGFDDMDTWAENLHESIGVILSELIPMMMNLQLSKPPKKTPM